MYSYISSSRRKKTPSSKMNAIINKPNRAQKRAAAKAAEAAAAKAKAASLAAEAAALAAALAALTEPTVVAKAVAAVQSLNTNLEAANNKLKNEEKSMSQHIEEYKKNAIDSPSDPCEAEYYKIQYILGLKFHTDRIERFRVEINQLKIDICSKKNFVARAAARAAERAAVSSP